MKRQTPITLMAITIALLLGGCGQSDKPSANSDKQTEQNQSTSEGAMTQDSSVQRNGITLNGMTLNGITLNGVFLKDLAARPLMKQK